MFYCGIASPRRECGVRNEELTLNEIKWFRIGPSGRFKRLPGPIQVDNSTLSSIYSYVFKGNPENADYLWPSRFSNLALLSLQKLSHK
jgi:hypothetical protein